MGGEGYEGEREYREQRENECKRDCSVLVIWCFGDVGTFVSRTSTP